VKTDKGSITFTPISQAMGSDEAGHENKVEGTFATGGVVITTSFELSQIKVLVHEALEAMRIASMGQGELRD
jgi:hypothetical protein